MFINYNNKSSEFKDKRFKNNNLKVIYTYYIVINTYSFFSKICNNCQSIRTSKCSRLTVKLKNITYIFKIIKIQRFL